MRNNETGEFELLVGNRQLLSGFFIVVLLFAVAFSMGYIVGRNSSPSAKLQTETASSAGAASQTPETRPQPVAQAPAAGGTPGGRAPIGCTGGSRPPRCPAGRRAAATRSYARIVLAGSRNGQPDLRRCH